MTAAPAEMTLQAQTRPAQRSAQRPAQRPAQQTPQQPAQQPAPQTRHPAEPRVFDPARIWLAGLGIVCVGLGGIGVVVPGLPTTVFLIVASWCFARSCPWLEQRLIRNRFFAPFVRFLEPGVVMPTRARVISTCMLWAAVLTSSFLLVLRDISLWVPAAVVLSGAVGTVMIWRVARARPGLEPADAQG